MWPHNRAWRVAGLTLLLPTLFFIVVSLALLLYTFVPLPLEVPDLTPAKKLTILAHGVHDNPATWSDSLAAIIARREPDRQVVALDWSRYADSVFRCSVDGLRLGKKLGNALTGHDKLQHLHLIGHSCGSFVIYGICLTVKRNAPDTTVMTTYLDPVSVYGGIFQQWGLEHFGDCADDSEAYIDTGDTVPGSNQPLPHARTIDVTGARVSAGNSVSPHLWPVVYYTVQAKKAAGSSSH